MAAVVGGFLIRAFRMSFWISVGSTVALFGLAVVTDFQQEIHGIRLLALGLSAVVAFLSAPVWYLSLGIIASRLGKSWILWTGVTFITAPFGPPIAYARMNEAIKQQAVGSTTAP